MVQIIFELYKIICLALCQKDRLQSQSPIP